MIKLKDLLNEIRIKVLSGHLTVTDKRAVKHMIEKEIRLGNIFSPPVEVTFEPWVKAWAQACTGLNCDGLSRGFWNSVKITIPSVFVSIAIASINGYALANWRFKGANLFFTILILYNKF